MGDSETAHDVLQTTLRAVCHELGNLNFGLQILSDLLSGVIEDHLSTEVSRTSGRLQVLSVGLERFRVPAFEPQAIELDELLAEFVPPNHPGMRVFGVRPLCRGVVQEVFGNAYAHGSGSLELDVRAAGDELELVVRNAHTHSDWNRLAEQAVAPMISSAEDRAGLGLTYVLWAAAVSGGRATVAVDAGSFEVVVALPRATS